MSAGLFVELVTKAVEHDLLFLCDFFGVVEKLKGTLVANHPIIGAHHHQEGVREAARV